MTCMRKLLLVLSLVSIGVSAIAADNGFKFNDPNTQAKFVAALRNEGVPFKTLRDGMVTYDAKMEERVSQLRLAVLQQSYKPNYHFVDRALEDQFTRRLRRAGISYGLEMEGDNRLITWAPQDNDRVKEIKEDVLNSIGR